MTLSKHILTVASSATVLCSAVYFQMVAMNDLNPNMHRRAETLPSSSQVKLFNDKLHLMRCTDHKNGTPFEARRPRFVYIIYFKAAP